MVMTENIVFHSDYKFTRIYDTTAGTESSIRDYYNYMLESKDKSRTLITTSTRTCPRYNRVCLMFSYPES